MIGRRRYDHVLAIYPNARGFGVALFEGPSSPLYWSNVEVRGKDKNNDCIKRILAMLHKWAPDVLVLQTASEEKAVRRAPRIYELNAKILSLAEIRGIFVVTHSRSEMRATFQEFGVPTKQLIAETIAINIPVFERYVPDVRKPWMSEDARMGIFDAAALALTYYRRSAAGEI